MIVEMECGTNCATDGYFENPRVTSAPRRRRVLDQLRIRLLFEIVSHASTKDLPQSEDGSASITDSPKADFQDVRIKVECGNNTTAISDESTRRAYVLDTIYRLSHKNARLAMDHAVDYLDDLLNEGLFVECDEVLRDASVDQLSNPVIVSFLGITRSVPKTRLPSRNRFFERAVRVVASRRGIDEANELLGKYK